MAGIDKTYVNRSQYLQARKFWCDTYQNQIADLGETIFMYPFSNIEISSKDITPGILQSRTEDIECCNENNALWNTCRLQDIWLSKNCHLDFVQNRLKEQYSKPYYFKQFDAMDFSKKPFLGSFILKGSEVEFFNYERGSNVEAKDTHQKYIVYGTTLLHKTFFEIQQICDSYSNFESDLIETLTIQWYGLNVQWYKGKWYNLNEKSERENLIEIPSFLINTPEIKYSFNRKDMLKFKSDAIIIATEKELLIFGDYLVVPNPNKSKDLIELK